MQTRTVLALVACMALATVAARDLTATNPCLGKKDGTLLPSSGCSAVFYQCYKGKPVDTRATTCPKGQAFNPVIRPQGCALVGAVGLTGCDCGIFTGNNVKACQVCQARQRTYSYPLPGNKGAFVQCSTQGSFWQRCNANLQWNQTAQNCL